MPEQQQERDSEEVIELIQSQAAAIQDDLNV
jgi:hypothetical protein